MDPFMETLLGGRGCSVDGTMTRNPITGMANQMLDSHLGLGSSGFGATTAGGGPSMMEEQGFLMPPGVVQSPLSSSGMGSGGMEFPAHWMQNFNDTSAAPMQNSDMQTHLGMASPGMQGMQGMFGGSMFQPSSFLMMQQQQQQMMHMQQQQFMMQQQQQMRLQQQQQQHQQQQQSQSQRLHMDATANNLKQAAGTASSVAEDENWNELFMSKYGLSLALEEALDRGELTSERLDEIWKTFGKEFTADDPAYQSTSAVDWREERDRQHQAQGIVADNAEELLSDVLHSSTSSSSAAGYKQAWDNLSAKLEGLGKDSYQFVPENPYYDSNTTSSPSQPGESFERGMELFRAGKVREAILAFEAEVQRDNEHSDGWRMLGACHAENDEDKKAIVCLRRAVEADSYNVDALLAIGTCYVNELDSVRALEALRSWVTHNPIFQGVGVVADEYSDGSLMDEVVQLMLAVATQAPANADVQVVLGVLYNVSQDYEGAVECFRKALMLRPDDYSLYNKLGATLANSNKSNEALALYTRALEMRPAYARGWLNMGISHANLSKYEESAKAYVRALHLTPTAKHIWGYLRVVLTNLNRLDLAELSGQEDTGALAEALGVDLSSLGF